MRRVFGNELDLIRIYGSRQLMDIYHPAEQTKVKVLVEQNGEELDFSQMLKKEIEVLAMM